MPIAIAKKIHKARKRSSHPRLLNAEIFWFESVGLGACWFSRSTFVTGDDVGEIAGVEFFRSGGLEGWVSSGFSDMVVEIGWA